MESSRRGGDPLVVPLVRSNNYHLDAEAYEKRAGGLDRSFVYSRETNPTIEVVERRIAALEGAERALVFASGMAAFHAVLLAFLRSGDQVVHMRQIYGGTRYILSALAPRMAFERIEVDVEDLDQLADCLNEKTRMVVCESISNPLNAVADLPALRSLLSAKAPRALLVVDATLATPIAQRPLEYGADIVFHSASKYLGGHSDLVAGVVSGRRELMNEIFHWRTHGGACMDPAGAYILDRGIKTLALRMRAHTEGALLVAKYLDAHPRVLAVHYCGLPTDPAHQRAERLLDLTGGLLGFVVEGGDEAATRLLRRFRCISEAASLGSVETLASRPRDLSQSGLSEAELRAVGIADGLVRLCVGIEAPVDLMADLSQALGGM
jgi:methionine-gamma-lyase